ncbi:MAG: flagellar assembly protein FliW [Methylophilaceae bacterium]
MNFTLTRFGSEEVDIDSETIITFPQGIPPFDDCTHYKFFHEQGKGRVFWLQSLDEASLVFSVTDPALLRLAYEVSLTDEEQTLLQFEEGDELLLAVILFRDNGAESSALNAVTTGPIVLNANKRIGLQKMLTEFGAQVVIKGL